MAELGGNHPRFCMPRWQRRFVYVFIALLFVSGSAWLCADWYLAYRIGNSGELNETLFQIQRYKKTAMQVHGTSALGALIVFGSLLTHHVSRGWRSGFNRLSGCLIIMLIAILIITTAFIWYEDLGIFRDISAWLHWSIGLSLPVMIMFHRKRVSR
jgi:hypothetical protein